MGQLIVGVLLLTESWCRPFRDRTSDVLETHVKLSRLVIQKQRHQGLQLYRTLQLCRPRSVPTGHPALSNPLTGCVPHTQAQPHRPVLSESTALNP